MRIQTAFRLDKELLDAAKKKAKSQKRSLNNYIEVLLHKDLENYLNNASNESNYDVENDADINAVQSYDKWIKSLKKGD
ncbi:hypothetical protein [Aequorivita xiaoshiensis]|uniref:Uncharacterized protein n=1 Tax=Aequorivita xiaoshiensis TaxID=2874476 RepID=A0A9X1QWV0_9FLAO|nr:hypothetical protein [Aequorivita xiaoshiensis]MCG2429966.1 hypothetical protein [Aequorivita xiaoshiensis]